MNHIQQGPKNQEEISLVDLATTFVRRRRVFYVVFVLLTLVGVSAAILLPVKYEYVTLIQNSERAYGEYLEKPAATIATIENQWIPQAVSTYSEVNNQKLPFNILATNPDSTGLVRLSSEAGPEIAGLVKAIHQELADNVIQQQQRILETTRTTLQSQVASIEDVIESLKSSDATESTGAALASAVQKRSELKSQIDTLKPAESIVVGRKGVEQKGIGRLMMVAITFVMATIIAIFFAFFAEFLFRVRENLE